METGIEMIKTTDLLSSEMLKNILSTIYLAICAVQDFRSRRISVNVSAGTGTAAAVLCIASLLRGHSSAAAVFAGLLPGVFLLICAFAARGSAGFGDGICFLVLGMLLGARTTWILLFATLLSVLLCGIILILLRRAGRQTRLPFLTFAAAVRAGILLVQSGVVDW